MTYFVLSTFLISEKWLWCLKSYREDLVSRLVTVLCFLRKIKKWHCFNQDMLDWLLEFQIFFSRVLCQFQHVYGCQVMKIWHIATCPRFSYKIWLKSKIKRWHYFNQDMLDWLSEFQIFLSRVLCQFQHVYGCQVMKNWHWATCPSCSSKWKLHTRKTSLWSRHDAGDENRIEIMFWLSWSSQCEK